MACLPLWWCVQGACRVPCFCPCSGLFTSGSWVFWPFYILSIICSNYACMQLFFLCILSRCKHCSKGSQVLGPGLSQTYHASLPLAFSSLPSTPFLGPLNHLHLPKHTKLCLALVPLYMPFMPPGSSFLRDCMVNTCLPLDPSPTSLSFPSRGFLKWN